jgi:hypothetical protein
MRLGDRTYGKGESITWIVQINDRNPLLLKFCYHVIALFLK